jgi:hypothetical protein
MPTTLPSPEFEAAARAASLFSSEELDTVIRLAAKRREFDWSASQEDWKPFDARLVSAGIDRSDSRHLFALRVAVTVREQIERRAEIEASKNRLRRS